MKVRGVTSSLFWAGLTCVAGAVFVLLCVLSARRQTPTIDEFAHLPAGCAYWKVGDLSIYRKNPPLVKLWMSIPVALDSHLVVPTYGGDANGWGPWEYGKRFLEANRELYFSFFFRARLMVVVLGLMTGAIVFLWTRRLFGLRAAAVAASLFLLSPTVMAHSSLATIDVGCMLTILVSCWFLRQACLRHDKWPVVLAGGTLGLALAVKFTALFMLPVAVVMLGLFRWNLRLRPGLLLKLWARDVALLLLAALFVVNAAFAFRGTFQRLDAYRFELARASAFRRSSLVRSPFHCRSILSRVSTSRGSTRKWANSRATSWDAGLLRGGGTTTSSRSS